MNNKDIEDIVEIVEMFNLKYKLYFCDKDLLLRHTIIGDSVLVYNDILSIIVNDDNKDRFINTIEELCNMPLRYDDIFETRIKQPVRDTILKSISFVDSQLPND